MIEVPNRLLRKEEVLELLGNISYVTLWEWMKAGKFPTAKVLSRNVHRWEPDKVRAFLAKAEDQVLSGMPGHTPPKKKGKRPPQSQSVRA